MTKTKAFAAVCVLLVLVGGSVALAPASGSRHAGDGSEQVPVLIGQTEPETMEVVPKSSRILRDQPMTFAVRVVADPRDWILLGFEVRSETPTSFEFHNPAVEVVNAPIIYPNYDTIAYIPADESDAEEYVPVTLSLDRKLPKERSTVEVTRISRDSRNLATDEFTFDVRCPVGCHAELMFQWSIQNIGAIIAFLAFLVAFFGRERIWDTLGFLREDEDEFEDRERLDPETGREPSDADATGDNQ